MTILITGGGGFLGSQLTRELRNRATLNPSGRNSLTVDQIVLADIGFSTAARAGIEPGISLMEGDLCEPAFSNSLLESNPRVVFHLAAMVSGDGERDFDGCWRTNLEGTRHLLEACRKANSQIVVVFASSLAVFGGVNMPAIVSDRTRPSPQTTYGMTKLMGELMINDYSRKGFIDGRAARLPTVFIRPGKPNAAASSFASGMFREPLNGQSYFLPLPLTQGVPLLGYRRVIENLVRLAEVPLSALGDDRVVTMPSTRHRISEMMAALAEVAQQRGIPLGSITERPDDKVGNIVRGWPQGTESERAQSFGMKADSSIQQVINEYIMDFL